MHASVEIPGKTKSRAVQYHTLLSELLFLVTRMYAKTAAKMAAASPPRIATAPATDLSDDRWRCIDRRDALSGAPATPEQGASALRGPLSSRAATLDSTSVGRATASVATSSRKTRVRRRSKRVIDTTVGSIVSCGEGEEDAAACVSDRVSTTAVSVLMGRRRKIKRNDFNAL
ncbi:hypothetical protein BHE74_00059141 [Ensete ventricosum]|nr:hypothetical protein BHE74_00059141 [Ensete ventricosum]